MREIPDHVARVFPQVPGDYGVGQTAGLIARLVREGRQHYAVRCHSALAVETVPPANPAGMFGAVAHYCRNHFRFLPDSRGAEQLKSPWLLCGEIGRHGFTTGDCDDFTILTCSLGDAVGFPVRIATLATGKHGNALDHARGEMKVKDVWRCIDFTPDSVYNPVRTVYWRI